MLSEVPVRFVAFSKKSLISPVIIGIAFVERGFGTGGMKMISPISLPSPSCSLQGYHLVVRTGGLWE